MENRNVKYFIQKEYHKYQSNKYYFNKSFNEIILDPSITAGNKISKEEFLKGLNMSLETLNLMEDLIFSNDRDNLVIAYEIYKKYAVNGE